LISIVFLFSMFAKRIALLKKKEVKLV